MYGSREEQIALDQIEQQLVGEGYYLLRNPSQNDMPVVLGGYRPDAIALGKDPKIVIEIRGRSDPKFEKHLSELKQEIESHDGWRFRVYYFEALDPVFSEVSTEELDRQSEEILKLARHHPAAALVLGWSLLEASARNGGVIDERKGAIGSVRIMGILASEGIVARRDVPAFLELAQRRNLIVHGQLDTDATVDDVQRILDLARSLRNAALEHVET